MKGDAAKIVKVAEQRGLKMKSADMEGQKEKDVLKEVMSRW